jgi:hypothetical protein
MNNLISDLDFLYQFLSDEFRTNGINLLVEPNNNNKKIQDWLKTKTIPQRIQLLSLIENLSINYNNNKLKQKNDIKFQKVYTWISIILITMGFIGIILNNFESYEQHNYLQFAKIDLINTTIIMVFTWIFIITYLNNLLQNSKYKSMNIEKMDVKINTILNNFNLNKLNPAILELSKEFQNGIINFMKSYDELSVSINFSNVIRYSLLDDINYFFNEQKEIIYKNIQNLTFNNNNKLNEFIEFILDKKKILEEITLINNNIKIYSSRFDNIAIISNQDILVKEFIDNLLINTEVNDKNLIINNVIFKIFKNKLKILIENYDIKKKTVLKAIQNKINLLDDNYKDSEFVNENYNFLLYTLFDEISYDEKINNYMNKKNKISSKYINNGEFIEIYKDLSLSRLNDIKKSITTTTLKINKLLSDFKTETEKEFIDKKRNSFRLLSFILTIITVSALWLYKFINTNINKNKLRSTLYNAKGGGNQVNQDDETINDPEKNDINENENENKNENENENENENAPYIERINEKNKKEKEQKEQFEYYLDYITFYSIWFFCSILVFSFWYKNKLTILSSFAECSTNTKNIVAKLSILITKIDDLTIYKSFIIDKTKFNNLIKKDEKINIINKYGFDFTNNNNNVLTNIIKNDDNDNIYKAWNLNDIEDEIIKNIYSEYITIMNNFEQCNFINVKQKISFPLSEIILYLTFIIICVIILLMVYINKQPFDNIRTLFYLRTKCISSKSVLLETLNSKKEKLDILKQTLISEGKNFTEKEKLNYDDLIEKLKDIKKIPKTEDDLKCEKIIEKNDTKNIDLSENKMYLALAVVMVTLYASYNVIVNSFI